MTVTQRFPPWWKDTSYELRGELALQPVRCLSRNASQTFFFQIRRHITQNKLPESVFVRFKCDCSVSFGTLKGKNWGPCRSVALAIEEACIIFLVIQPTAARLAELWASSRLGSRPVTTVWDVQAHQCFYTEQENNHVLCEISAATKHNTDVCQTWGFARLTWNGTFVGTWGKTLAMVCRKTSREVLFYPWCTLTQHFKVVSDLKSVFLSSWQWMSFALQTLCLCQSFSHLACMGPCTLWWIYQVRDVHTKPSWAGGGTT